MRLTFQVGTAQPLTGKDVVQGVNSCKPPALLNEFIDFRVFGKLSETVLGQFQSQDSLSLILTCATKSRPCRTLSNMYF